MVLQNSFVTDLTQAENEYDVMAFCYDEMLKYISDTDVGFVAKIDCLESDVEFKPFAQKFEELRQIIISSSDRINVHCDSDGIGFDAFKNILIETLRSFQCPEQIEQKKCPPVCLFYVLEALDIHIEKNLSLRRFTKGYYIKQPNMDCQPTEFTALSRHRAVFSWAGKGGIPICGA